MNEFQHPINERRQDIEEDQTKDPDDLGFLRKGRVQNYLNERHQPSNKKHHCTYLAQTDDHCLRSHPLNIHHP